MMAEVERDDRMKTKECMKFLERIQFHFSYLFDQYGFQELAIEEDRVGDHCLIVLESAGVRIKFTLNQGSVEATLGAESSKPSWEDLADGEVVWFSMREVVEFLRGDPRPTNEELESLGNRLFSMSPDEHLKWLSKLMDPHVSEALRLFGRDGESWQNFASYYNS